MSAPSQEPSEPRIIKKKKGSAGHHGGAWKVAYADFVTAMMALFIVLWIMSQSQSIRQAVAQYFKNPGILAGASGVMETSDIGGKIPTPGHSQELQTPAPVSPDLAQDRNSLEEVKKRLEEVIAQLPELNRLRNQVFFQITDDGLLIELMERENSLFFDVGSANVKPEAQKILSLIATELGGLPNKLTIEGHTDSRPYGSQTYTNWELSADRANAARRLMEAVGLRPEQIFALRGFADRQLRNPQDPLDFQNRRVSIIVMFQRPGTSGVAAMPTVVGAKGRTPHVPGPPPGQSGRKSPLPGPPPAGTGGALEGPEKDLLSQELMGEEVKRQLQPLHPRPRMGW